MLNNLANQNPMVSQFNGFMNQNPNFIPFQNNQLINQNVHVMNNLNNLIHQHKVLQDNIPVYQQMVQQQGMPQMMPQQMVQQQGMISGNMMAAQIPNSNKKESNAPKTFNIIKEMLKPQKIIKNNRDIATNYSVRNNDYKVGKDGHLIKKFKIKNKPYKTIIKDKIVTKKVKDITEDDLVVHKSIKEIDANVEKFNKELDEKEKQKEEINKELEIEFHIDNYDKHKQKFVIKETFIKNLPYDENGFDENKVDYIEFYRKKQKEAEEGQKLCDQILHNIIDEGIISKDELPSEPVDNINSNAEIDLKLMISNIESDEESDDNEIKKSRSNNMKVNSVKKNQIINNKSTANKTISAANKKSVNNKPTANKTISAVNKKSINTKPLANKKPSVIIKRETTKSTNTNSKQLNSKNVVKV